MSLPISVANLGESANDGLILPMGGDGSMTFISELLLFSRKRALGYPMRVSVTEPSLGEVSLLAQGYATIDCLPGAKRWATMFVSELPRVIAHLARLHVVRRASMMTAKSRARAPTPKLSPRRVRFALTDAEIAGPLIC